MRYYSLRNYLKDRYGCRVAKLSLDAGLTCPNRDGRISFNGCIFCNEKGSGSGASARGVSIEEQVNAGLRRAAGRADRFISYFQAYTNTYAPLDQLEKLWKSALNHKDVVGLSIGTRPDCVSDDVLDLLADIRREKDVWLELGLQSASDETLALINRGHTAADFADAVARAGKRNLGVVGHVIIGLPGEGESDVINTARFVNGLALNGVKIHSLYVTKGTLMAKMLADGAYSCLTQDEYVRLAVEFLERINNEMVVHRLTGDPDPNTLLAPEWSVGKSHTINLIRKRLDDVDAWQGKKTGAPRPIDA